MAAEEGNVRSTAARDHPREVLARTRMSPLGMKNNVPSTSRTLVTRMVTSSTTPDTVSATIESPTEN